jgi:large repetitive protein
VNVANTPSVTFVLDSTSDALTADDAVTINEEATFVSTVTVPQVTTPLVVHIVVPATMEILSTEVQSVGGAISDSSLSGGADLSSSVSNVADAKKIEANFGTIANNYDGSGGSDNTIVIVVVVRAKDVAALSGFAPQSTVSFSNEMDFTHANPTTITSELTVVEPELSASMPSLSPEVDAGDVSTFTITLDHTSKSTSTAHDITLHVYLQDHLAIGFDPAGSLSMVPSTTHTLTAINASYFTIRMSKLLLSDTIVIPVPVEVQSAARPGEELALGVVVDWNSIAPVGQVTGRCDRVFVGLHIAF